MEILKIENLEFIKKYKDQIINEKEVIFIKGKSGSGKSTLLKLINNSINMDSGRIFYKDKNILNIDPLKLRREIILSSQENFLFDETIKYNFDKIYKLRKLEILSEEKIKYYTKLMDLDFDVNTDISNFSGGEKQRIFLAICISLNPSILLLDEPTSALDIKTSHHVMSNIIKYSKENNITLIIVTHSQELIDEYADKIIDLGE